MLKNGQTYVRNLVLWTTQDFFSIFVHFSTLCLKGLKSKGAVNAGVSWTGPYFQGVLKWASGMEWVNTYLPVLSAKSNVDEFIL